MKARIRGGLNVEIRQVAVDDVEQVSTPPHVQVAVD